jgi:Glutathionylspermidine synthase preATP-grasp
MYPNHPNLLRATYSIDEVKAHIDRCPNAATSARFVGKPKYGREGVGITYSHKFSDQQRFVEEALRQSGINSAEHYIGEPAGICIREDSTDTTNDNSCFVPHYVTGPPELTPDSLPRLTARQSDLWSSLYDTIPDAHTTGASVDKREESSDTNVVTAPPTASRPPEVSSGRGSSTGSSTGTGSHGSYTAPDMAMVEQHTAARACANSNYSYRGSGYGSGGYGQSSYSRGGYSRSSGGHGGG